MSNQPEPGHAEPEPSLDAIMGERRQLINVAYRLLGSFAEAEDVVQETYARWYAMSRPQREAVESPVPGADSCRARRPGIGFAAVPDGAASRRVPGRKLTHDSSVGRTDRTNAAR